MAREACAKSDSPRAPHWISRFGDLLLEGFEGAARWRRAGVHVALERERRTRRALARGAAQRIIFAQRIAFPIVGHLNAPHIGVPVERDAKKIVNFALGPIGGPPQIRGSRQRRIARRERRRANADAAACRLLARSLCARAVSADDRRHRTAARAADNRRRRRPAASYSLHFERLRQTCVQLRGLDALDNGILDGRPHGGRVDRAAHERR